MVLKHFSVEAPETQMPTVAMAVSRVLESDQLPSLEIRETAVASGRNKTETNVTRRESQSEPKQGQVVSPRSRVPLRAISAFTLRR